MYADLIGAPWLVAAGGQPTVTLGDAEMQFTSPTAFIVRAPREWKQPQQTFLVRDVAMQRFAGQLTAGLCRLLGSRAT